ncbi:hypothetical protein [Yoonia sp.]|uniref:hypothetical protein n=1 Tax=Yoonia sp. TaxID=2212373 RepID=UPI003F6D496C
MRPKRDPIDRFSKDMDENAGQMLIVGDLERWQSDGRIIPDLDGFAFVDIADLTAENINGATSGIVVSPLVADGFDAVDVADRLVSLGFQGRYRVIAPSLPDAALIRDELQRMAPDLDFDLLLMPAAHGDD